MGAGGDARPIRTNRLVKRIKSSDRLRKIEGVKNDLIVLKSIWLNKASGQDHASRLEAFYGPQAHAYDRFRSSFLWGRKPLLAACAARLQDSSDLIWVDLGGGTGENVDMMAEYIPLHRFKAIYVVDLCHSLCEQAKKKVQQKGWKNVHVVEGDACTFQPAEGIASLVTFSYSLSMIPPFHSAIDHAISYLDPNDGLLGVTDFYVSSRYDLPCRQLGYLRRFLWRATFDTDNIDVGPERRAYLDHRLSRVWEVNSQIVTLGFIPFQKAKVTICNHVIPCKTMGSIPYVPFMRAPYYIWIGRVPQLSTILAEPKTEAPSGFPATFLYTMSWEDPRPDMQVLNISKRDTVLTLSSGGCNSLNLLLHGAGHVVSVDCNPAQSALLELKATAIRELEYEDVWAMFGEGRHPHIQRLFETKLAPFLSQTAIYFWQSRLWYFKNGLYYQGGMGSVIWMMQLIATFLGMGHSLKRLAHAQTLQEQQAVWNGNWFIRFCKQGPCWLVDFIVKFLALIFLNRFVLWFGGGVPCKQYRLIQKDGLRISQYIARTLDGAAMNSHMRKDNYFYFNCCTGRFARDSCPSYLTPANFKQLKGGDIDRLEIMNGVFMQALMSRKFSKVILMDHVDWLDEAAASQLASRLSDQVVQGGRVIWRSAAEVPPYARLIADAGFKVTCLQQAKDGYMDRVNMYSSFWVAERI